MKVKNIQKVEEVEAVEVQKDQKIKGQRKVRIGTVSFYARKMILSGLSNDEILDGLKDLFPSMDWEKRKNYPQWYRNEVKNKSITIEKLS